jgi:hypothetical protein
MRKLGAMLELSRKAMALGFTGGAVVVMAAEQVIDNGDDPESAVDRLSDWLSQVLTSDPVYDPPIDGELTLAALGLPTDRVTALDLENAPEDLQLLDVHGTGIQVMVIPHCLSLTVDCPGGCCDFEDFHVQVLLG